MLNQPGGLCFIMVKKLKDIQVESDSQNYQTLPSDKALLDLHQRILYEYLHKRNLDGLRKYLSPELTAIGSADGEFWTSPNALIDSLQTDVKQIPQAIEIFNHSFRVARLNDICAVVSGHFSIRGKTAQGIAFENIDCQLTAVYCLCEGNLKICHLHGSQKQQAVALENEPWPLHGLATQLYETAEKYRFLLDNSPVGIMQYDCDGYLKEYNAKFLKVFGTTAEKTAGICLFDLPDKQACEALAAALHGHTGFYEGYYRSITVDKVTPLKMVTTPIYNSESRVVGGIAIVEDTSEHRITQDRLQYQLQLEKMISSVAQGLVMSPLERIDKIMENALELSARFFGADRGYIFQVDPVNKTISNTHEWHAKNIEPLIYKYQNYPLADLPGVLDFIDSSVEYLHYEDIKTMPESMTDFKKLLIEDKVKSILLMPMLAQGKFIGLFGYDCVNSCRSWNSEEITLLKIIGEMFSNALLKQRADRQIHNSDERYRFLSENINDIIWIFDVETKRYRYISPTLTRIFGYTPEELMQLDISVHLPPESLETVNRYLPERLANLRNNRQTRYIEELDQLAKDGRLVHTELTQNWVINKDSGHAEIIGITRDITERKELEEQRRLLVIQRQQSLKADSLGRMAGAIAHHFNNQLQVILGNLELLGLNRQIDEKSKKHVGDAIRATQKAAEMSSMMLTYLGQHQAELHAIDLSALCQNQLEILRHKLPAIHQLEIHVKNSDATIRMNRDQLQQIIRHTVANASEASINKPGTIVLEVDQVASDSIPEENRFPADWVPISDSSYVCLRIRDQGTGIAKEEISKTFDPFFSTKGPGRGLGMANALGFMRSVGGGITLNSVPENGCCFSFYFPGAAPDTEKKTIISGVPAKALKIKTILVVEDEEMVRFITRSLLENFDYKVIEATDGAHAIEIFKALKNQIDLVICDLVMPGIDGWQTLAELRRINPDIPAILASGYDQSMVMRGEHADQPQAFISKPYNSKSLQQAIWQVIESA
ncbi:MAG: hypothetical protein GQF41_3999 [Candidatus Rifleibacterium amylolyticum]|nr:MAG: hypothetical protein GQF41_3999 [Candidatus Rifleibacterium amylolyticum]